MEMVSKLFILFYSFKKEIRDDHSLIILMHLAGHSFAQMPQPLQ